MTRLNYSIQDNQNCSGRWADPMSITKLLGDIGATHARFALLAGGDIQRTQSFMVADYENIEDAIQAFLNDVPQDETPTDAALAVAGPVTGDRIVMMNSPWSFSVEAMRQHFGWSKLYVINDFAPNALAVPQFSAEHLLRIPEAPPV